MKNCPRVLKLWMWPYVTKYKASTPEKNRGPPPFPPTLCEFWADKGEVDFQKLSMVSNVLHITSEGLWEMCVGDLADKCIIQEKYCKIFKEKIQLRILVRAILI